MWNLEERSATSYHYLGTVCPIYRWFPNNGSTLDFVPLFGNRLYMGHRREACTAHSVFPNACIIIARITIAIFPRFSQNLVLFLFFSNTSRIRTRPDTRLQIRVRKSQHVHPAAWNVVHSVIGADGLNCILFGISYCISNRELSDGNWRPFNHAT
jgi:hypothetical protein